MIYLTFLWALGLTVLAEGAAMALLFRKWRYVYCSLLCNLLTNPALNFLLLVAVKSFGADAYAPALFVLEAAAVLVEGFVIRLLCGFSRRKAAAVSLFLNALSFLAGALIQIPFR